MRCLLVSDLHYTLRQFDWVLNQADSCDVVVIAGDHLDIASAVDFQAQITVIFTYLRRLRTRTQVIVCSGNHDLDAQNEADEKFARWILKLRQFDVPTDGDSLERDGTLFTVCPWWDGPVACQRVAEQLERDSTQEKARWVWVYHAPPDESPTSWGGKQSFGDSQLTQWIRRFQPDMVLTGHIHQSPFKSGGSWADRIGATWVFNPGRQIGPTPTHVILDTQERRAFWSSLAGMEQVCLDQDLMRPIPALERPPPWLIGTNRGSAGNPACGPRSAD